MDAEEQPHGDYPSVVSSEIQDTSAPAEYTPEETAERTGGWRAIKCFGNSCKKLHLLPCGLGSFYNDVMNKVMFSFALVYYMRVAALFSKQAGLVLLAGQVGNFAGNFVFGYCSDKVNIPWLSARIGRRKSWHLFGTVFTAVTFVPSFSRCFICTESSSLWLKCAYFVCLYGCSSFFYGAVETAHASLIPQVAADQSETVMINAFRTGFSYFGGVVAYVVAWITLGQSEQYNLSPSNWKEFTIMTSIHTVIGLMVEAAFYIGTKEPTRPGKKKHVVYVCSWLRASESYSVAHAFKEETQDKKAAGEYKSTQREGRHESRACSSIGRINAGCDIQEKSMAPVDDGMEKGPTHQGGDPQTRAKPLKRWLKDSRLYMITFVFTMVITLENTTYTYLALYLTDYLRFEKEAAAYCSLIFLCSGIVGSGISKGLSKALGKNWAICIAAVLTIGAATGFYFVTPSARHVVYGPVVVIGCGVSGQFVMALSFVTDVMWHDKQSAGFLFSFASCTEKLFCAGLLMLIQAFYPPASSSGDCEGCGAYVRWTYPLALGVLSVAVLLFFARNCEHCPGGREGQSNATNTSTEISVTLEQSKEHMPKGK